MKRKKLIGKKDSAFTISDEEWQEFVKWWKSKYLNSPDRTSAVTYLQWKWNKVANNRLDMLSPESVKYRG